MAIGRPIELTPNITSKNISIAATEGQTEFTVTGGYRINELSVYRNGVRLVDGRDFSATDGNTVTFISDTVVADDIVEFSVLDNFDIAGVIVGAASTQTLSGNLHVTGEFYAGDFKPTNLTVGVVTANTALHVGSALTADSAGDVNTIGVITATAFYGDGSNLSNITSTTINNNADNRLISGSGTANTLNGESNLTFDGSTLGVTGAITASGAVNVDATTDSTSVTTGALIVDGGVGIAKNVYIGAGLSVAGTLTYEDVTNVDSVGMVTAKSGVNVSGGELNVGLGFSVGNAGIITSTGGIIDLKNSGSVSNIKFYCESSNAHYTQLQSAAHSAYAGNVTLTLPTTTDTLIGKTTTDTLTNKTLTSPTLTTPVFSGQATGELKVGSGITMAATSGLVTFADATYTGGVWTNALKFGTGGDTTFWQDGSNFYIQNTQGNIVINSDTNQSAIKAEQAGAVSLYYGSSNNVKLATTNDGVVVTGIMTASAGANYDGILSEKFNTTAGRLHQNTNIDLENGMIHYFTTQENSTSTPNIRYSSSKSLNNMLAIGDCITVTIITTAESGAYSANWTIDGSAVTEEWVGGSAPSEGGSDGHDIYTANILKTADATFKVIINLVNAT